jgi:hypothetical protein
LKTYNKTNFFKYTYCEFKEDINFEIPERNNYKSKSNSLYYFTEDGVYRESNHWGRVASCRWRLTTNSPYKNQQRITAFAKWKDFYHLNEKEKLFFVTINFETKKINIKIPNTDKTIFLFTLSDAQRREKEIKHLFKEVKWAKYFDESIEKLRYKIIMKLINSNLSLQQIKTNIKLGL